MNNVTLFYFRECWGTLWTKLTWYDMLIILGYQAAVYSNLDTSDLSNVVQINRY